MSANFRLPPTPSFTCSKYLRYGVVEVKPFEPGQRYRSRKDMENTIRGYRSLSQGIRETSVEIGNNRKRMQSVDRHVLPQLAFHNSTVSYSSQRMSGNAWSHRYDYNRKAFPPIGKAMTSEPGMKHAYRYFGTRPTE
ncbi:hypothetical protein TCAL_08006 [Tigriopus californicus]|uniref:Uncharacterized protein n=1 Tax=Tigriopus californicus TaxID=6832 RepID=A0A553PGD9_TIGCA|nr:uncharacterized protein LOC131881101 [Tigriopus californicus]TRY76742.1 hypothetical protein TCAL_08006 [Tigriopus californicus]